MAGVDCGTMIGAREFMFGTVPDGTPVRAVTLQDPNGISARLIAHGATLQSLSFPDRHGVVEDVVLGYPDIQGYLSDRAYIGASIGRYANRIARGRFALDGEEYALSVNDGTNTLHGGVGFDRALWDLTEYGSGTSASAVFRMTSPDGDQGFPGTIHVTCRYVLEPGGVLRIIYQATSDKRTIVNLTNHTYWNLTGHRCAAAATDHTLELYADRYLPTDQQLLPVGNPLPVKGTLFDFTSPAEISDRQRALKAMQHPDDGEALSFDHHYVATDQASQMLRRLARIVDPSSGRSVAIWSNQPGCQFYSGGSLASEAIGKAGRRYRPFDGIAIEPQLPPDTPNNPCSGVAIVEPGAIYHHEIEFRMGRLELSG